MVTGNTHVDVKDNKRVCIHLNPPQGPSYARRPNLIFRLGEQQGDVGIKKIGVENLELLSDALPNDIMKALKKWLSESDLESDFRAVWGQYTKLKGGLLK